MYKGYVLVNKRGEWLSRPFGGVNPANEYLAVRMKNMSDKEKAEFSCIIEVTICD